MMITPAEQGILLGDRQAQSHAVLLEGNRRLEERGRGGVADAGTGIMHLHLHLAA